MQIVPLACLYSASASQCCTESPTRTRAGYDELGATWQIIYGRLWLREDSNMYILHNVVPRFGRVHATCLSVRGCFAQVLYNRDIRSQANSRFEENVSLLRNDLGKYVTHSFEHVYCSRVYVQFTLESRAGPLCSGV